jgi:hypothetical protein
VVLEQQQVLMVLTQPLLVVEVDQEVKTVVAQAQVEVALEVMNHHLRLNQLIKLKTEQRTQVVEVEH